MQELDLTQFEEQLARIASGITEGRQRIIDLIGWNLPDAVAGLVRVALLPSPIGQRRGIPRATRADASSGRIPDPSEIATRSRAIQVDIGR